MEKADMEETYLSMIQSNCIGIVQEIDNICRRNNINYSLCGGSVIGAHLFQGFIPWDDDIDLMMTRKDYDKFVEVFPKQVRKQYRLLNYKVEKTAMVPTLFSRVEDLHTEVTEEIAGHVRKGHVFVDITVMDNVPSKFAHKIYYVYGSYVYSKLYRQNGMTPGTGWKKALFSMLSKSTDTDKALKTYARYENFCRKSSEKRTKYCAELMSAAYSGYLYKRELFDSYLDIVFENTKLMVIRDYMDYLHMRYGDREFTKDVPQNQRFNSHIIDFKVIE